jgi:hypothetical protein
MPKLRDLAGQTFGYLTVIKRVGTSHGQAVWQCKCRCGKTHCVIKGSLTYGGTKSCGCLRRQILRNLKLKHGQARSHTLKATPTPEYRMWTNAKTRCFSAGRRDYKNYGGRGITMCAEWVHDFAAFFAHIGPRPSTAYSIDRIDNDRGYEPGNVRWATRSQQNKNQRHSPRRKHSH